MGWKGAMQSWYSWAGTYTGTALSTLHWFLIWSPHNHVQFYYVPYFIVEKTEAQRGCAICWKCQSWDSNLRIPILKPSYSHPSRLCLCHTACMSLCSLITGPPGKPIEPSTCTLHCISVCLSLVEQAFKKLFNRTVDISTNLYLPTDKLAETEFSLWVDFSQGLPEVC